MRYNRFAGDPALKITEDGADLEFVGGQPIMDQGLENAAIISLFTRPGWWGNTLFDQESEKIGSGYEDACNQPIVAISSINDVSDAATKALNWMRDANMARNIGVTVTNPRNDYLKTDIKIEPPGQDIRQLLFLKNGINWISQALNPAHTRLS
jgi:phage gp46-like protein